MNSYSNAGHKTSRNWSQLRKWCASLSTISWFSSECLTTTPHYLQQQWGGPLLFGLCWVEARGLVRGRSLWSDLQSLVFHKSGQFPEGSVEEADRIQGLKTINIAVLFGWQNENCKQFRKKIKKNPRTINIVVSFRWQHVPTVFPHIRPSLE